MTCSIDYLRKHSGVRRFIEKVLAQIYTEEEADKIEDELMDHIYSLSLDYMDTGYNKDAAISKALLQMGDPSEIGYSFTDYDAMKKRRFFLVGLKVSALLILVITLGITFYSLSKNDTNNEQLVQVQIEEKVPDNVFDRTVYEITKIMDDLGILVLYILCSPMLFLNIIQYSLNGIPIKYLDISKDPLLILWPCKKRFPWEYLLMALFFIPILLVFGLLFAYDGNNPINMVLFLFFITLSITLYFRSEKYRIPKYIIVEDGIIIKGRLITYTSIDKIAWSKDYMSKNHDHYKLIIESVGPQRNNTGNYSMKRMIDINSNQYAQVTTLFKERL